MLSRMSRDGYGIPPKTVATGDPMSQSLLRNMNSKRAQLSRDGFVILRQVVPPEQLDRLRSDIETVVERQKALDPDWDTTSQPRASIGDRVDADTLGAFEFLLHDHTYGVSAGLMGCPRETVAGTSALVLCNPEFTPGDPQKPGQSWGTDPRNWHRDVRPDTDGPLSAILEDQLANGPGYLQWNIALYQDHHLSVVPGSHRRLTGQAETSHMQQDQGTMTALPKSLGVELEAGDGVVYNNVMLHWGSGYTCEKKRHTIHLGYRCFGRIFPHQRECYLPLGFWNQFADGTPQRRTADRWFATYRQEFTKIERLFRAALAGDSHGFSAGLAQLHPAEKGRLTCLILLSKIALKLKHANPDRGSDEAERENRQVVYDWQLEELSARFSESELQQLRQRFGQVDDALKTGTSGHVSGFLGPTTDYEFEKMPTGMTTESVSAALLSHQPSAGESATL